MQNPTKKKKKNGQRFIVFKKPSILSKKLKTLTSSNYDSVEYFFAEIF